MCQAGVESTNGFEDRVRKWPRDGGNVSVLFAVLMSE
jgi:hypothetical protein